MVEGCHGGKIQVVLLAVILGQPGAYVTLWLLADLISKESESLALILKINTFIGCYTGLMCHLYFCMKPLMYQKLSKKLSDN